MTGPFASLSALCSRPSPTVEVARKDYEVEYGPASEKADDGGKCRQEDRLHPRDPIPRDEKKSTESIGTRFLVGIGCPPSQSAACLSAPPVSPELDQGLG